MGETSSAALHAPFVGCSGSGGGDSNAGVEKSNISVMSSAHASLAVSGLSPKRTSMNLRNDVDSRGTCETYPGFTHGEITIKGTLNPERVKPGSVGAAPGSSERFVEVFQARMLSVPFGIVD